MLNSSLSLQLNAAFYPKIVMAVLSAANAAHQSVGGQKALPSSAGELAA